jgi:hypothetical protein
VKVVAGDFDPGSEGSLRGQYLTLEPSDKRFQKHVTYNMRIDVKTLELAGEKEVTSLFGAAGWAAFGGLVAGAGGLVLGGLVGGKRTRAVFVAEFKDRKRLVGECDPKEWSQFIASRHGGKLDLV